MTRTRVTTIEFAALAAPLVLIVLVRIVLSPAPVAASGAALVTQPTPMVLTPRTLTSDQQRARAWIESLDASSTLASPFELAPKAAAVVSVSTPQVSRRDPAAGLRLTSVLGSDRGGFATINGRVYRPGDRVNDSVTLVSIDVRAKRVVLQLEDGRRVELSCDP